MSDLPHALLYRTKLKKVGDRKYGLLGNPLCMSMCREEQYLIVFHLHQKNAVPSLRIPCSQCNTSLSEFFFAIPLLYCILTQDSLFLIQKSKGKPKSSNKAMSSNTGIVNIITRLRAGSAWPRKGQVHLEILEVKARVQVGL